MVDACQGYYWVRENTMQAFEIFNSGNKNNSEWKNVVDVINQINLKIKNSKITINLNNEVPPFTVMERINLLNNGNQKIYLSIANCVLPNIDLLSLAWSGVRLNLIPPINQIPQKLHNIITSVFIPFSETFSEDEVNGIATELAKCERLRIFRIGLGWQSYFSGPPNYKNVNFAIFEKVKYFYGILQSKMRLAAKIKMEFECGLPLCWLSEKHLAFVAYTLNENYSSFICKQKGFIDLNGDYYYCQAQILKNPQGNIFQEDLEKIQTSWINRLSIINYQCQFTGKDNCISNQIGVCSGGCHFSHLAPKNRLQ